MHCIHQNSSLFYITLMHSNGLSPAGKCHISQANFTPNSYHKHTQSHTHTQANTCVNRCFTVRELVQLQKSYFLKNSTYKHQHLFKDN